LQEPGGINLQDLLKGRRTTFGREQNKRIIRWLKTHNLRMVKGERQAFNGLLDSMGFLEEGLGSQLQSVLELKVNHRYPIEL
jgi:hypothetical protein